MNMNNDLDSLFKLTPDYVKEACKVAGNAFQDDPFTIFTYPDETERKEKLHYNYSHYNHIAFVLCCKYLHLFSS